MSMSVNYKSLIGKFNSTTRAAVEAAAGLCVSRTHYAVEIEHYLMKLLDSDASDFSCILRHFEVNRTRLASELTRSLDGLKSGEARTAFSLSPDLLNMMSEAWTLATLDEHVDRKRPTARWLEFWFAGQGAAGG